MGRPTRLRFSLKTLLIVATLLAAVLGPIAYAILPGPVLWEIVICPLAYRPTK